MKEHSLSMLQSFVDGAIRLGIDAVLEFLGEVFSSAIAALFT
jgi:hypothetical protein